MTRREVRAAAVRLGRQRAFILSESGQRVTWRRMRQLRREARRELSHPPVTSVPPGAAV